MSITYDFDLTRFDFAAVHAWLAATYWSPGIAREKVEKGFRSSTLCIGAYLDGKQIGAARCISDLTRFAYVSDVYVDDAHRKKGIAREMVKRMMDHPLLAEADNWYLITLDAQPVYAAIGYNLFEYPERFMVHRRNKK